MPPVGEGDVPVGAGDVPVGAGDVPVGAGVPLAVVFVRGSTRYLDARTACALDEGATPLLLSRTTASASVAFTLRLDLSRAV